MTRRSVIWISTATVLVLVLVAALVAWQLTSDDDEWAAPEPAAESAPAGLASFYEQELDWGTCGEAECATVTVPIDYEEPDGDTTSLQVVVVPAEGDSAERSLFVNPGGPGGSAVDFAYYLDDLLGDDVRETYDVVAVDPRGVAESSPLECLGDEEFDEFVTVDPDPDDDQEVAALRESITELGQACLDNSGDLAAHVSTEEAARDMDVVRALLGRETFDWFGASYGTQLGATYAELFPEKVGRMVLDGAVDPSQSAKEGAIAQTTGFQRALEAYADDCVTQDDCPLGDDAEAGLDRISDLLDGLDQQPLPGQGDRQLTESQAFYGIAVTLYDQSTWPLLSQSLTAAFDGNGAGLLVLADAYFTREADGSYPSNQSQVIYAINCLDARDRPTLEETEAALPEFEQISPVFGRELGWGMMSCADWPIESENPQIDIRAEGAAPIIVLGTTRDPATPYESAEALASQLESGVLVTREGDGHTAYTSGNECITDVVDTYLVDGTVPEEGLVCEE